MTTLITAAKETTVLIEISFPYSGYASKNVITNRVRIIINQRGLVTGSNILFTGR